jgi:predicted transposase YbfD/YdcC
MTLIEQLKTIPDPRGQRGKRHPLWLTLFIALLGSLCGYQGYRPLAAFCAKHRQTFLSLLNLDPQTVELPSYSTFRRVFQLVDAQAWVNVFNVWAIGHAPEWVGQLWSIDGKSIRCTSVGGNTSQQNFASLVSIYGTEAGVVQLELMYNAQISEVEVAKRLLKRVTRNADLAQSLPGGFSLDALHAKADTLSILAASRCHYVVSLKANQKTLFLQAQQQVETTVALSEATHQEQNHGRQTQRHVRVYAAPAELDKRWHACEITRIIWVKRDGIRDGQPFVQEHFYISNWALDAAAFLDVIRQHWQIENGLHWVKDVTLKEDDPPRRGGYAPISWAVIHSFLITAIRRLGCRTIPDGMRELANQVHDVFRLLT